MSISIKRVYDPPSKTDGHRVLVDRLWPRGLAKAKACITEWCKDVAPTPELRKWFGHKMERFDEFTKLYRRELETDDEKIQALEKLTKMAEEQTVTLLYAAKDEQHNHALVLEQVILERLQA